MLDMLSSVRRYLKPSFYISICYFTTLVAQRLTLWPSVDEKILGSIPGTIQLNCGLRVWSYLNVSELSL